jgi:hypothetical protein
MYEYVQCTGSSFLSQTVLCLKTVYMNKYLPYYMLSFVCAILILISKVGLFYDLNIKLYFVFKYGDILIERNVLTFDVI